MKNFKKFLIAGAVIVVFCLCLFMVLANNFYSPGVVFFDEKFTEFVMDFWTSGFIIFFSWITYLGEIRVVVALLLVIALLFVIKKQWFYLIAFLGAIGGGEIILYLVKNTLQRPRPDLNGIISLGSGFSFPSGHAMISIIFYGLCAYFLVKNLKMGIVNKYAVYIFTIILVALIGFSRIFLGVHWFSDIVAGYALGLVWLVMAILFLKFFEENAE